MSTSHSSPMRILKVSPPSFKSLPRSGTLISPSATCRTTGCPIHVANTLGIPPPCGLSRRQRESRFGLPGPMVQREQGGSKKVLEKQFPHFLRASQSEVHRYCFFGTCDP